MVHRQVAWHVIVATVVLVGRLDRHQHAAAKKMNAGKGIATKEVLTLTYVKFAQ